MYFWKILPIQLGIHTQNMCGLSERLSFPPKPKGRLKPIFRRPFATLLNKSSRRLSPNIARTSKLHMFQQLIESKPCPVSTYPAHFRPTSSNADCCIFSRARFAMSKNFRWVLSGGGVRFGKLFGMAEAG